jgi:hypothetical protein
MPTAENAQLKMEVAQEPVALEILADSGDHTIFTTSEAPLSRVSGFTPTIRPNGVKTGGAITPAVSGTNNLVDVAALTCNLAGVETSVAADTDVAVTRTAAGDAFQITSITVNSGGTIAAVAGTEGPAFSETRAAAGGPPLIPVGSIEIGQVRLTSNTDAAILASEIKQVPGTHKELAAYPLYDVDYRTGEVTFVSALPLSHTGAVPKRTYAEYYTPVRIALPEVSAFKAPEESHSITSTQTYDGTRASSAKSLNQGSFNEKVLDGVTDFVVQHQGKNLWWQFFPDRAIAGVYLEGQGILGVTRNFPADGLIDVAATISSEQKWTEVS